MLYLFLNLQKPLFCLAASQERTIAKLWFNLIISLLNIYNVGQAYGLMMKPSRTLWGPPRHKSPFMSPISCLEKNGFGLLGLPWVPKSKHKQLLIREVRGCKNKGKAIKQSDTDLWVVLQELRHPPTPIHPPTWRMVTTGWTEAHEPRIGCNQKVDHQDFWNITLLPHLQPIRRKSCFLQPSPQMLPLKTFPWKPSGSSGFWVWATHTPCLAPAINSVLSSPHPVSVNWLCCMADPSSAWQQCLE